VDRATSKMTGTTNDNVDALRFYQRRGFCLVSVHRGAVDSSRPRRLGDGTHDPAAMPAMCGNRPNSQHAAERTAMVRA